MGLWGILQFSEASLRVTLHIEGDKLLPRNSTKGFALSLLPPVPAVPSPLGLIPGSLFTDSQQFFVINFVKLLYYASVQYNRQPVWKDPHPMGHPGGRAGVTRGNLLYQA